MDLAVKARMDGPYTIVSVSGDISNSTAHALKLRLFDLMDYRRRRFIMDMTDAVFSDYTGVAALVMIIFRNRELLGTFRIVAGTSATREFLIGIGIDKFFPVYTSVEEAKSVPIIAQTKR